MKQRIIGGIGTVLILAGCLFLFNKPVKNFFIEKTTEAYEISNVTKEEIEENEKKEVSFDFDAVEPLNLNAVAQSQLKGTSKKLPVIASVAVPRVGICLPVFKGLENDGLYYGAGTLSPDQEMGEGNYGIASHRSDRADLLFTPLEEVRLGDRIYLTDLTNVYTYVAIWKEKVDPSAVDVLDVDPKRQLITLLTCGDIYATTRLVVQGELERIEPMDKITEEAAAAFDLPMKTY
ncbi:class A sortase [Enterococcus gilvus]|uniref:class A sortase n=1 Tax=Enterococcus gilvus TaxID=160453 RepID=UPI00290E748F|nr:class A sortase [Enterococcus gilvus]MDU5511471.1 class A sortase [Enterococcus gilvus]